MPYITATYILHPQDPSKTSIAGYSRNPANLIADEVVSLVRNLRKRDLERCNVILDVKKKEVVKCRSFQMHGKLAERDYQTLLEYFIAQYPSQVQQLLNLVNE
jgi:c-di-GMP-related signal transduction protein